MGVLLIALGLISLHRYQGTSWNAPPPPKPNPAAEARAEAIRNLDLSFNWTRSAIGSTMLIDVTLTNKGARDVRDILIACEHRSDAGPVLDVNTHIYWDMVKASETKKIDRFDMGLVRVNGLTTKCYVKDLVLLGAN